MGTSTPTPKSQVSSPVLTRFPVALAVILAALGFFLVVDIALALQDLPLAGQTLVVLSVVLAVLAIGLLLWWLDRALKAAEESARAFLIARTDLQEILDSQTEAVVRYAPDGTITFVNRAWSRVYGATPEAWIGRNAFDAVPAGMRAAVIDVVDRLSPEQPLADFELSTADVEGRPRRRRLIMQGIFDSAGRKVEIQGTGLDVTEAWLQEQELARYRDELERLVEERTEKLQRQTQVALSLQHVAYVLNTSLDLETVLTTIVREISRVRPQDAEARVMFAAANRLVTAAAVGISAEPRPDVDLMLSVRGDPAVEAFLSGETVIRNGSSANGDLPQQPSAIAIPLRSGRETLGVLLITGEPASAYEPADVRLLQSFAAHAGLALANARQYGSSTSQATANERLRLSRELHDSVTQTLFSASLHAEVLPLQMRTDPETALITAERLGVLNRGALGEMRSLLLEMRPEMIVSSDMQTLLGYLCSATQTRALLAVTLSLAGRVVSLPPEVHVAFYRVAQEALNNVTKHAAATSVTVSLVYGEQDVTLVVADDGRGLDADANDKGTLGLRSMRERAQQIDADLAVSSGEVGGTVVRLCWPYDEPTAAAHQPDGDPR